MKDHVSKKSRLHIITDGKYRTRRGIHTYINTVVGSLLSLAQSDPKLSTYGFIVVDEAHQHTVSTDLLLGLLKGLSVDRREDLKIIIMSATIDTESFLRFFPGSSLVTVPGRTYPVHISYLDVAVAKGDLESRIVDTILSVHLRGVPGNILVFVSGVPQINKIASRIRQCVDPEDGKFAPGDLGDMAIYRLFATSSAEEQDKAVDSLSPAPVEGKLGRKLILATNIAETSVTLTGVTHVIDSCRVKSKVYNPEDESYALRELWISKAQAQQRAGRAGRTQEGFAYRMCTETGYYSQLTDYTVPDIQNSDMLSEVLQIIKIKRSPFDFPYMSGPATETVIKAVGILHEMGALERQGAKLRLTSHGENLLSLPVSVFCANALLESAKWSCVDEMIMIVSMIERSEGGTSLFKRPEIFDKAIERKIIDTKSQFHSRHGDHLMLLNIYLRYRETCERGASEQWLDHNMMTGNTLKRVDHLRDKLLRIMGSVNGRKQFGWTSSMEPGSNRYSTRILFALAGGFHLRVAKHIPAGPVSKKSKRSQGPNPLSSKEPEPVPEVYETVRHGARAELHKGQSFGPEASEWVIYHEFSNNSEKAYLNLVTPIPLKMLMETRRAYWCDTKSKPTGHIRDALVKQIIELTGCAESEVLVDMPPPPQQQQQQQQ
jgi:pre-mRNA-splicing factor ATP-dependent RNA helicase DHX15/PRP43